MRVTLISLVGSLFALAGCTYPPADIIPLPVGQCEIGGTPPAGELLFVTERMPDCTTPVMTVTDLRASHLMYGAVGQDRSVHFYHPADWWAALREREQTGNAPLLFIHGYNNSNQDALTAAYAIRTAVGPGHEVIALTWPSYAVTGKYTWDEANAAWATDAAELLISELGTADPVTIVAHSMGNRIALDAVRRLSESTGHSGVQRLIMASPDVDRATAISEVPNLGIPVTVYASTRDQALSLSWQGHGLPRAGDLSMTRHAHKTDPLAISNSNTVDVVDTSRVTRGPIGHTDYIASPEGAADLCRVVNGAAGPVPGRRFDSIQRRWILLKDPLPAPTDRCVKSGSDASRFMFG